MVPVPKPKPILKFYSIIEGDDSPTEALRACPAPSAQHQNISPKNIRQQWVDDFFKARNLALKTEKEYRRELEGFLEWTSKPLTEIRGRDIGNYKYHLETLTDAQGRRLRAAASVGVAMTALKSWFKWLVVSECIESNPTVIVTNPPQKKPDPKHLEEVQIAALYAELAKQGEARVRDTAILAVLEHGLRAEEVSRLNLGDYDGTRVYIREAKRDSTGWVPLAKEASQALDAYLEERRQQGELLSNPDAPLFCSHSFKQTLKGMHLGYDGIYKLVRQLGERAGIPDCHPHRLRHTFATRLVLMGIDSYLARKLTRQYFRKRLGCVS